MGSQRGGHELLGLDQRNLFRNCYRNQLFTLMLSPLTTYTWRIDALGLGGSAPGVTQSFTTGENLPAKAVNLSPANGAGNLPAALVNIVGLSHHFRCDLYLRLTQEY